MEANITTEKLIARFPEFMVDAHSYRGDHTAVIKKEAVLDICRFLRDDEKLLYNFMMDLTAVDYLGKQPRFEVVYHLYSLKFNCRFRLKAQVPESDCHLNSVVSLWPSANWFEREAFDLYGIKFDGHPELSRILLYDEFQGHPLRKDYPLKKRQPLIGPTC